MNHIWRLFSPDLREDQTSVTLTENEHHYAIHILRIGLGEEVEVGNGMGLVSKCKLSHVSKKESTFSVIQHIVHRVPQRTVSLFVALPKKQALSDGLRYVSELGVSDVFFFDNGHQKEPTRLNPERLMAVAIEGYKVSKNAWLTRVHDFSLLNLKKSLEKSGKFTENLLACDEHISSSQPHQNRLLLEELLKLRGKHNSKPSVTMLLGSERGFSQEDREFMEQEPSIIRCSLGSPILTVPVAMCACATLGQNIFSYWSVDSIS